MANEKNNTADREIRVSRLLDAPIELVWAAWTDPEHIKNWWGPDGFTNTISRMELQPEGVWELVMHGPDGTDYKNKSVFKEISRFRRIVYEHVSAPKFVATIEFTPEGDRTHISWQMLFESKEALEQVVKTFKADEGLKQNVEKLGHYLSVTIIEPKTNNNRDHQPIVLERTFNAPVATVWKALTDKDEMKKWYFDLPEFRAEQGFQFQFTGGPEEGIQYVHLCAITEVIPEQKLTYSWRYQGYEGISYVTFELKAQDGGTLFTLTHKGIESFPASNRDLSKGNFEEGWNQIIHTSLNEYLSAF